MAHASVTLSDVWSTHHNQAGLGWLDHSSAGVFFENRFGISEFNQMGVAASTLLGPGSIGLSYSGFGWSSYMENKIGLGYGMKLNDKISAGVQVNYQSIQQTSIYGTRADVTAELGIQAKPTDQITIGVHVFNPYHPERGIQETTVVDNIPTIMRFGVGYQLSDKVLITCEAEKDIDFDGIFRAGFEYLPTEKFYVRGGIATNPGIAAFGFGMKFDNFRADLASTYHFVTGFSPQISLSYDFGK